MHPPLSVPPRGVEHPVSRSDSAAKGKIAPRRVALIHIDADTFGASLIESVISASSVVRYQGFAETGKSGLDLCRKMAPAMALLDLMLPDMDGFRLVDELALLPSPPRVLVLTSRADDYTLDQVQWRPIAGLVWKAASARRELGRAVDAVAGGGTYFPPDVKETIQVFRNRTDAFFKILSKREQELMPLFGIGMADGAIAARVSISAWTIHSHRKSIMHKLGLHRESELVIRAIEMGFVHIPRSATPFARDPAHES
jgi:DNA-binding NarL/FixJ family response regulator